MAVPEPAPTLDSPGGGPSSERRASLAPGDTSHYRWIGGLFFASGLSALVYETLWVRLLGLVFGNTVQATTTVLAAFMCGLAVGSLAVGSWIDRTNRHPLKVYAGLELGIAAAALALPFSLERLNTLYRVVYHAHEGSSLWLGAARFVSTFLLVLLPAAFMGGTLPTLARVVVERPETAGRRVGRLYSLNLWGGVAGVLLCGFALIPGLGTDYTNAYAAAINLTVAATAAALASRSPAPPPHPASPNQPAPRRVAPVRLAYFLSGLAALGLEVASFRLLLLVFGSTTYAFTVMLATFLAGLGLGSGLVSRWADGTRAPERLLAAVLATGGLATFLLVRTAGLMPLLYLKTLESLQFTWSSDLMARAAVAVASLLIPTLCFGATLPLVARLEVRRGRGLGRSLGTLYAVNTLGAIAGSLLTGFVLVPYLGMLRALQALAVILMAASVAIVWKRPKPVHGRLAAGVLLALTAALLATQRPWDRLLLSEGVYMAPFDFAHGGVERALARHRLLHFEEGRAATVSVIEDEGLTKSFRVDGKSEITTLAADKRLGRLMGHLPLLLHGHAQRALNIGLGAGLTVAGVAAHPVADVDVVELEPRVAGATRLFAAENHDVLSDPRVHLLIGDGRNHLNLTQARYDVITSDPFEPTVAGAASLFTVEHFQLGRAALFPGGVMCQYLPLYELGWSEFVSIARSFRSVFPHVSVWFTGRDTLLIGTEQALSIDFARLAAAMAAPRVHDDLADVGLADPERLLGSYVFDLEPDFESASGVPLNTDRRPFIEFRVPRKRWHPTVAENVAHLLRLKSTPYRDVQFADPAAADTAGRFFAAQRVGMEAWLQAETGNAGMARVLARQARALDPGEPLSGEVLVEAELRDAQAALFAGHLEAALAGGRAAVALDPAAPWARLWLAERLAENGRFVEAEEATAGLLSRHPGSIEGRMLRARLELSAGRPAEAEEHVEAGTREYPRHPAVRLARAKLDLGRGNLERAESGLRALLTDPSDPALVHFELAVLLALNSRAEEAGKHLAEARRLAGRRFERRIAEEPMLRALP